jgi:hypothetical protein
MVSHILYSILMNILSIHTLPNSSTLAHNPVQTSHKGRDYLSAPTSCPPQLLLKPVSTSRHMFQNHFVHFSHTRLDASSNQFYIIAKSRIWGIYLNPHQHLHQKTLLLRFKHAMSGQQLTNHKMAHILIRPVRKVRCNAR